MTLEDHTQGLVRGVLESLSDDKLILSVPGTSYQLHLVPTVPASQLMGRVGKRIKGTIHANALRVFVAKGGGRFIEPIWGQPRIIAGYVLAVDQAQRRVLVDAAVPMWMTFEAGQTADAFKQGELVNCYLQSGTTFTPA